MAEQKIFSITGDNNITINNDLTVEGRLYVRNIDIHNIRRNVGEVALFMETKSPAPEFPFFNIMESTRDLTTENWPDNNDWPNDNEEPGLIQYLRSKKLAINSSSIFFFSQYKRNEETVTLKLAYDSINATLLEGLAQDYRVHSDDSNSDWKNVQLPSNESWRSITLPANLIDANVEGEYAISGFSCDEWTLDIVISGYTGSYEWQAVPDATKYDYNFSIYPHRIPDVTNKARHFSVKGAALFSSGGQNVEGMRMIVSESPQTGTAVYGLNLQVYIFGGLYQDDIAAQQQPYLDGLGTLNSSVTMDGD